MLKASPIGFDSCNPLDRYIFCNFIGSMKFMDGVYLFLSQKKKEKGKVIRFFIAFLYYMFILLMLAYVQLEFERKIKNFFLEGHEGGNVIYSVKRKLSSKSLLDGIRDFGSPC